MTATGLRETSDTLSGAFVPAKFPPELPAAVTGPLQRLLSQADRALARLDGIATVLPDEDLFVAMYIKKEALLSSQIEGTQASLEGVLEFEANLKSRDPLPEVRQVVNYIAAMKYGLERLKTLPLSLRLLREMHKMLLQNGRGAERTPGEFRRSQNWIGAPGMGIDQASFVPPSPDRVPELMAELERFLHAEDDIPMLIKCGLLHAQFETIHPFLDGNGRIGRLLITFYLLARGVLHRPLLYLSYYLKKNRAVYYEMLTRTRRPGEWEGWLAFFLQGIIETCQQATDTARRVIGLQKEIVGRMYQKGLSSPMAVVLLDRLFAQPIVTIPEVEKMLQTTMQTANELAHKFEEIGILVETTGKKRYRIYEFRDYLNILREGTRPV